VLDNEILDKKAKKLYRQTILAYLHFSKITVRPVSIASARAFVANNEKRKSWFGVG
jgi:hypothetical protein